MNTSATIYPDILPYDNTNVTSTCVINQEMPNDPIDPSGRDLVLGQIIREELSYEVLHDEFEDYDEEYLFEMSYANPDLMYLGEPDDTAYINFYNYRVNSTIAEFIEIQELILIQRNIQQHLSVGRKDIRS